MGGVTGEGTLEFLHRDKPTTLARGKRGGGDGITFNKSGFKMKLANKMYVPVICLIYCNQRCIAYENSIKSLTTN